jgi:glutathione S-transferase
MQLYGSTRSPFSRKALVAVHELHLVDRIEFVPVVVSQTQTDPILEKIHPLGQIPVLVLDDGRVLHDSFVVCEYLDRFAGGSLVPAQGEARWEVLARHSFGQALLETLVKLFAERKRTSDPLQPQYVAAFTAKVFRVLPTLDAHYGATPDSFDLGDIAIACALSYADFRFPQHDWRAGHGALAAFYATATARPSMRATAPGVPTGSNPVP